VKWYIGADEAGRGSLVGEMIVAVVAVPEDAMSVLAEAGVRDSKELFPQARAQLYRLIASTTVFAVTPVSPRAIDSENLTVLTEEAIADAYRRIAPRIRGEPVRFVVDRYGRHVKLRYLLRAAGYRGPLIIEEKADARYLEVAAASIVAKHVRDARIRVLRSLYGVPGTGYPSDERTVSWVLETVSRGERPPIIRYSWGTLESVGARVKKGKGKPPRVTLDDYM